MGLINDVIIAKFDDGVVCGVRGRRGFRPKCRFVRSQKKKINETTGTEKCAISGKRRATVPTRNLLWMACRRSIRWTAPSSSAAHSRHTDAFSRRSVTPTTDTFRRHANGWHRNATGAAAQLCAVRAIKTAQGNRPIKERFPVGPLAGARFFKVEFPLIIPYRSLSDRR